MTALAAPGGLSATVSASGSVTLAWTDTNSDESRFEIERSTDVSGSHAQIGMIAADAVAYEDASEI